METSRMKRAIAEGLLDEKFERLYGEDATEAAKARYLRAIDSFETQYGENLDAHLFSVPGRSELSGNHTDHNGGLVIAAAVHLDIIAIAAPQQGGNVRIKSEGFGEDTVNLETFQKPRKERMGKSDALIAGVCRGFAENGYRVGGFCAYTTSSVLKGSGLSSSAAFENMIGNIENHLYNGGTIDNVEIAKISRFAENVFFGKPCGLMDQMASAVGGITAMDFENPSSPSLQKIDFDFHAHGYLPAIVNTGGNHADLTPEYAAVPAEMKAVAKALGGEVLRDTKEADLLKMIPALRPAVGDRAILRALHFFAENRRVKAQASALREGDLPAFLSNVMASGRSSFCYLQNVYTVKNVKEQGLSLALCLAETFFKGKPAAFRLHGGGFAGTILAFLPSPLWDAFHTLMDGVFGKGATVPLHIRQEGAILIL